MRQLPSAHQQMRQQRRRDLGLRDPIPPPAAKAARSSPASRLIQLRDEIPTIVAPGCWGLFGGHLDPGETPEQALRRELLEEISWQPLAVELVMQHVLQRQT